MNSSAFREKAPMPSSVLVALAGMLGIAAITVFAFVRAAAATDVSGPVAVAVGVTIATSIMFSFVPLLSAWGLRAGWKASPALVTIVGAWTAPRILIYVDPPSVALGALGIAAIIAVWLPSAREYRRAVRSANQ